MGRKRPKEPLPVHGKEEPVRWLPRDIRMGWTPQSPKGTLLLGRVTDKASLNALVNLELLFGEITNHD